jgi:hypothetical protein
MLWINKDYLHIKQNSAFDLDDSLRVSGVPVGAAVHPAAGQCRPL